MTDEGVLHQDSSLRMLSVQVLPNNLSKYVGVTKLLQALGLSNENLMALGDGENDIDMLKASKFLQFPSLPLPFTIPT